MTGSAIAIPLLGAAGAGAAEASTWDHVAECESGGMWNADLGNGHYGGLQISQANWDAFGGGKYAASPDLASRSQQIAIAEKILDAQGPTAWPSCAPIAGLKAGGAAPAVDPGGVPEASSGFQSISPANGYAVGGLSGATSTTGGSAAAAGGSGSTGGAADASAGFGLGAAASGGSDSGVTADKGPVAPSAATSVSPTSPAAGAAGFESPAAPVTEPGSTAPDPADAAQGGKHRGQAASPEVPATGALEDTQQPGRHASADDTSATGAAVEDTTDDSSDDDYTVKEGDSLYAIAADHEVYGGWPAIYDENEDTVGSDPDLIVPGQNLEIGEK